MVSKMRWFVAVGVLCVPGALVAQWELQDAHTTASLRGIHSLGNGVAWASGTGGTVLRTEDGGANWLKCAVPAGAETLDFRGVQGFDGKTAIVMSSGKGDLSRLYKTVDGCQTWKLVFVNPDAEGFWDAFRIAKGDHLGILLGDPVSARFPLWRIDRDDSTFQLEKTGHRPRARKDEAAFAASNSSLFVENTFFCFWIGTGGLGGSRVIRRLNHDFDSFGFDSFPGVDVPVGQRTASSGIFSLSFRRNPQSHAHETAFLVGLAVGGDYQAPESAIHIAAWTKDGGKHWTASEQQPHGYRSSVEYDEASAKWIAVGPNGTDVSFDDGRNWRALKPGVGEAEGVDRDWNALSLPFVVGPKGRIGKLKAGVLK